MFEPIDFKDSDPEYRLEIRRNIEMKNYVHEGFDHSNSVLESEFATFRSLHQRAEDSFVVDEYELAYIARMYRAILAALMELKQNGTFAGNTYLII